jgi:hypothetical protein
MRGACLAASAVTGLAALAGCMGAPPLSDVTAPDVVDAAFAELSSTWRGNETSIRQATANLTTWSSQMDWQMPFEFEWGQDGSERVRALGAMSSGAEPMDLTLYCFRDREYLVAPNGTFEARGGTGWCPLVIGTDGPRLGDRPPQRTPGFNDMMEFRREGRPVTLDADGNAHATVRALWPGDHEGSDDDLLEATVSPAGDILALASDAGIDRQSWTFEYGPRRALDRPGPVKDRVATSLALHASAPRSGDLLALAVTGRDMRITAPAPASELSLRLLREGSEVAKVPLGGSRAGFTAWHEDVDGDSLVSLGDQIRVEGPEAGTLTVVLHDEWAGHDAGYNPYKLVPLPAWVAASAVAVVALFVARRR